MIIRALNLMLSFYYFIQAFCVFVFFFLIKSIFKIVLINSMETLTHITLEAHSARQYSPVFDSALKKCFSNTPTQLYTGNAYSLPVKPVWLLHHQAHHKENLYSSLCLPFIYGTMSSGSSCCRSPTLCSHSARGR